MINKTKNGHILSKDGLKLFFRASFNNKKNNFIVIAHGFAEHSGRYEHLFLRLNQANFNILAFDFRGHGYSDGKRGFINNLEEYLYDLEAAYIQASNMFNKEKGFLIAHSMGALISTFFAKKYENKLNGIILSSPFFSIMQYIPKWKILASSFLNKFFPNFSMKNGIKAEELTHDTNMIEQYKNDPLIFHHATVRWFNEIKKSHTLIENIAKNIINPIFIQLAEKDFLTNSETTKKWFKNCKSKEKKIKIYKNFYHEIYNEKNQKQVVIDIINWLNKQLNLINKTS